jgi:hypothetical protein
MGKKVNIQRDLQSRRDISEKNILLEVYVKPEITEEENAESHVTQEQETDTESEKKEVSKKRRRPS